MILAEFLQHPLQLPPAAMKLGENLIDGSDLMIGSDVLEIEQNLFFESLSQRSQEYR